VNEMEKLRVLLPHWLEHSKSHAAEFTKWAQAAGELGENEVAALISQAVAALQKADKSLLQALEKVGGPLEDHHHHHHRHSGSEHEA